MQTTRSRDDVREQLVEVAARLLREHGARGVTTRAVAEAAGVQAPTLYRLFGDKDGLLDAVAEHVMTTHVRAKVEVVDQAAAAGADPVDDLRVGWRSHVEFGLANPDLFRLLSDPERAASSAAASRGREVLASRVHRVARAGRLRVGEAETVDLVHAAGVGIVLTLLTTPPAHRDLGLAEQMCDAVLAHVLVPAPAAEQAGEPVGEPVEDATTAAAVTLRAAGPGLGGVSPAEHALLRDWLDRVAAADPRPAEVGRS